MKNVRRKLEIQMPAPMPCRIQFHKHRRTCGTVGQHILKPMNLWGNAWKDLFTRIMKTTSQEKGWIHSACGPKHCRFSRTPHGCLPTSCDTLGSKVPATLRDWQEQDTERAVLWVRSTKRSLRETDLGNTVVETRLSRLTLCCSAHK